MATNDIIAIVNVMIVYITIYTFLHETFPQFHKLQGMQNNAKAATVQYRLQSKAKHAREVITSRFL